MKRSIFVAALLVSTFSAFALPVDGLSQAGQAKLAEYKVMDGKYVGSLNSMAFGEPAKVDVWLETKATVVLQTLPGSNKVAKIASIIGYLYISAHREFDDESDANAFDKNDGHWECIANPISTLPQICRHYSDIPDVAIGIYQMGDYDPKTGRLQLWSNSLAEGPSGLALTSSGKNVSGIYYAPDGNMDISMVKQ